MNPPILEQQEPSSSSSSTITIFPELSRLHKYRNCFLDYKSDADNLNDGDYSVVDDATMQKRKRKRIQQQQQQQPHASSSFNRCCCFEIRQHPDARRGIGMFATRDIQCGDLIIPHEDPIVSSVNDDWEGQRQRRNTLFCGHCVTPLKSFRDHLGAPPPSHVTLPYLDEESCHTGPIFTTVNNDEARNDSTLTCLECQHVTWCSKECYQLSIQQHEYQCRRTTRSSSKARMELDEFYKSLANSGNNPSPIIFQLATKCIIVALVAAKATANERTTSLSPAINGDIQCYYWWKEYGSHPLWWNLGSKERSSSDTRRRLATEFCQIIKQVLLESIHSPLPTASPTSSTTDSHSHKCNINTPPCVGSGGVATDSTIISILEDVVNCICTVTHVGEILGMLQSNVMEFEYPSPAQQYMEFIAPEFEEEEQDIDGINEDDDKGGSGDDIDDCDDGTKDGQSHGKLNGSNKEEDDIGTSGSNKNTANEQDDEEKMRKGLNWLLHNVSYSASATTESNGSSDKNQDSAAVSSRPLPVLGSGLYPLLTLANHDCDPNASIEFLQESNRGSMVAIRNIRVGEEICITYIPNGDIDPGDTESANDDNIKGCGDRFRNFQPTRTWAWLNSRRKEYEGEDDDCDESEVNPELPEEDGNIVGDSDTRKQSPESDPVHDVDDNNSLDEKDPEGSNQKDRANALMEYGFECQCSRCKHEIKNPTIPYKRAKNESCN